MEHWYGTESLLDITSSTSVEDASDSEAILYDIKHGEDSIIDSLSGLYYYSCLFTEVKRILENN